jgi:hypothetical protein
MLYDDAGGRLQPPMGVLPFDGQDVFPQRGLAEAVRCDGGLQFEATASSCLAQRKKSAAESG